MGNCRRSVHNQTALSLGQRFLLLFYAALFGGILPFICWGALGMPGHPHVGPHFVFLPPPQHNPVVSSFSSGKSTIQITGNMAMGAEAHNGSTHSQSSFLGCTLADYGGVALNGAHIPHSDKSPVGQAYPSLLSVTLLLLIGLAYLLLARLTDRHGFRCWLAAWWPDMIDLRIPTPPPRFELCPI